MGHCLILLACCDLATICYRSPFQMDKVESENDYGFIWDIAELEADSSFVGKAVPDRDVVTVERSQM